MPYYPYQSYQPYQQPAFQAPQQSIGIIKVNGPESALQCTVLPPNSMSQALFDVNGKTFYVVSTDGVGAKTIEAFDYAPHVPEQLPAPEKPVTRQEFDDLAKKIENLIGAADGIHGPVQEPGASDRSADDRR